MGVRPRHRHHPCWGAERALRNEQRAAGGAAAAAKAQTSYLYFLIGSSSHVALMNVLDL
jgi:hypothetical protein